MKRRDFMRVAGAGVVAGSLGGTGVGGASATPARPKAAHPGGYMVVGCQSRRGTSKENLEFLARHGVFHMDPWQPKALPDGRWDLEDARKQVEQAAEYGIEVAAYHLPLSSSGIDNQIFPNIMLGRSPERDREIEKIQQTIQVAGTVGVPVMLYNMTILPVVRTGRTVDPKRGNASYSTWNQAEAYARGLQNEPTIAGNVDVDEIYERITYFLDRVLPVAEEYNVKLGNHIADPPLPVGYRGITRWNSPDIFEGIKRFAQLYDSPSHGFNLCLGSTAEGLRNPREEILEIIDWIGSRNQIFNIHLRNIKGGLGHFMEVYPDNGDMDFFRVVKALKDVGYDRMLMPDHVPHHDDPAARDQAFAFAYGHTKALLQAVYGWDRYGNT